MVPFLNEVHKKQDEIKDSEWFVVPIKMAVVTFVN